MGAWTEGWRAQLAAAAVVALLPCHTRRRCCVPHHACLLAKPRPSCSLHAVTAAFPSLLPPPCCPLAAAAAVCRVLVIGRAAFDSIERSFPNSARQVLHNLKKKAENVSEPCAVLRCPWVEGRARGGGARVCVCVWGGGGGRPAQLQKLGQPPPPPPPPRPAHFQTLLQPPAPPALPPSTSHRSCAVLRCVAWAAGRVRRVPGQAEDGGPGRAVVHALLPAVWLGLDRAAGAGAHSATPPHPLHRH